VAAEQLWRERRETLERELAAAAHALTRVREDERAAREAVFAALESARAELRAVRAARAADQSALATLTAELDAERVAHAVARATLNRLRAELAAAGDAPPTTAPTGAAPPDLAAAGHAPPHAASPDLAAAGQAPPATVAAADPPPAVFAGDLTPPDLSSRRDAGLAAAARAQVAAAAAAERRPAAELVADLDAAARALRGGAAERQLRRALVALAREDPYSAGRWLVSLLPAQAAVLEDPPSYDLTIRGLGTYAVTGADVRRIPKPRPRGEARFHLRADAATLAGLLAGEPLRVRRFRGRARANKNVAALKPLVEARLSLAEALRAGARLEPALVFAALPYAIDPEWTRGHAFTVAQEITERLPRTWYVTARDGERLAVSETPPGPPDATVAMSRRAFDALLRGDPCADLPSVRGDRAAVAALKAWTDRARA
jgi:hypothetical protein